MTRYDFDSSLPRTTLRESTVLTLLLAPQLLGRPSDDIDISTSPYPLTGFAFAELLRTYCSTVMGSSDAVSTSLAAVLGLTDLLPDWKDYQNRR